MNDVRHKLANLKTLNLNYVIIHYSVTLNAILNPYDIELYDYLTTVENTFWNSGFIYLFKNILATLSI